MIGHLPAPPELARIEERRSRRWIAPIVAAAALTAIVGVGFVLAAQVRPGDVDPASRIEPPASTTFDPFPDDPCMGPPPFAGRTPTGDTEAERAANRDAAAQAWEELKAAQCPAEESPPSSGPSAVPGVVDPYSDDPCKGPPPFAGRTPTGDTEAERAANRDAAAQAWEELKAAQCPAGTSEPPVDVRPSPGPPDHVPGPPAEERGPR